MITLNLYHIVDGFISGKPKEITFASLGCFRPWLSKVLSTLKRSTILERVFCYRHKDGLPHDISICVCGRYIRYDVDTNTFSYTEHIDTVDGQHIIHVYNGFDKLSFVKIMLPYLHCYFKKNDYYDDCFRMF